MTHFPLSQSCPLLIRLTKIVLTVHVSVWSFSFVPTALVKGLTLDSVFKVPTRKSVFWLMFLLISCHRILRKMKLKYSSTWKPLYFTVKTEEIYTFKKPCTRELTQALIPTLECSSVHNTPYLAFPFCETAGSESPVQLYSEQLCFPLLLSHFRFC